MEKTNDQLIKAYRKANKERKEKLRIKAGYKTEAGYLKFLGMIDSTKKPLKVVSKTKKVVSKKTIHNVFIMDDSGSMSGTKYQNGVKGIQSLVKSIKSDKVTNNTISIVDLNRGIVCWMISPEDVNYQPHNSLGDTPLYRTMGKTIDSLLKRVKGENVLLNIVTDGQDNCGFGSYANLPQTLRRIQAENNFTVTFVGTAGDVKNVQNNLNVDKSNTLVHDNTGAGMTRAFASTVSSRTVYSKSVSQGEDVKIGFYKKIGTL